MKICLVKAGVITSSHELVDFQHLVDFIKHNSCLSMRAKYNGKELEFVFWERDNDLRIGYFSVRCSYKDDIVSLEQCAKIFVHVFRRRYENITVPSLVIDSDVEIDFDKLKISKEGASSAPPFFDPEFRPEVDVSLKDIRERLGISQEEWDSRHAK